MRLSLKAKLTALISFLVLLVILVTSTVFLSNLIRETLAEVQSKGEFVAQQVYHQARTVLSLSRLPAGTDPGNFAAVQSYVQSRLAGDPGLGSLIESAVGYSPTLYYVAITDPQHQVMVHNDLGEIGHHFTPAPRFTELLTAGLVRQLRVISGAPRVYEIVLPLEMLGRPVGDVRVGVSTLFLRDQISPDLRGALFLSFAAVALATFSAGVLSFRLLRPLATISQRVDLLARGEYIQTLHLDRTDEWGILSSKLDLLGEQMRGEKAAFLRLQENLDQLFSRITDGLLLFDREDRLALATPAAERFLGQSPYRLLHRPAGEIFTLDHPLHRALREAFAGRTPIREKMLVLPGDPPTRLNLNLQFVEEGGERMGALVTLRDASTRAEIQDQIDVTTKLAAMARLTSGVAHEVKNPLNAMVLQLELLKSKLADQAEPVRPQIEILTAEIRRLDRVVKTFLDFTRPVEIRPAETEVEPLVREVFTLAEPQAQQNHVRLTFAANGAVPCVRVDRDLMKQALLNLVLNGCQAMPSGGELSVTPRSIPKGVELAIADQGVGIPPEAQQKVFSLYYTTKPNGSGVGLAMAFRIIQLHNGSIDFTSEINRGTTFRVTLPT